MANITYLNFKKEDKPSQYQLLNYLKEINTKYFDSKFEIFIDEHDQYNFKLTESFEEDWAINLELEVEDTYISHKHRMNMFGEYLMDKVFSLLSQKIPNSYGTDEGLGDEETFQFPLHNSFMDFLKLRFETTTLWLKPLNYLLKNSILKSLPKSLRRL